MGNPYELSHSTSRIVANQRGTGAMIAFSILYLLWDRLYIVGIQIHRIKPIMAHFNVVDNTV